MGFSRIKKLWFIVPAVLVIGTLFGLVVMMLWNWLLPPLFGLPEITFWQALGLFVLSKVLFGGWRHGPPAHWRWKHRMDLMSPEERNRIKQRFMCKWGGVAEQEQNLQTDQSE